MVRSLFIACVLASMGLAVSSFWIEAKAVVGQVLLERAWVQSIQQKTHQKPWPWADTWPVAKLNVPKLEKSLVVLEGVSGEAMAFGPGRLTTPLPEPDDGVLVIGGHRDSHLQFLQFMENGDELSVENQQGDTTHYRVTRSFVADSSSQHLMVSTNSNALILITCYPFNALQTGGPKRFVLVAQPELSVAKY